MSYAVLIFFLPKIVTGIHFASKFTRPEDPDLFYINSNHNLDHESHITQRNQFCYYERDPFDEKLRDARNFYFEARYN
jgi:hypothetical protein